MKTLDGKIALHVMKWPTANEMTPYRINQHRGGVIVNGTPEKFSRGGGLIPRRWRPSVSMADAWDVVEKLQLFDGRYLTETVNGWGIYKNSEAIVLDAETAAEAICLAALIVAEAQENDNE